MKIYDCSELTRLIYGQIGSGDQGYVPQAIICAVKTLDTIAKDENLPLNIRENAAFAAANLLISDHRDTE
jgi:uncharacterized protein (UPF0147 family)